MYFSIKYIINIILSEKFEENRENYDLKCKINIMNLTKINS
jgi:hypothetical protein